MAMKPEESRRQLLGLREQGFDAANTQESPSVWLARLWPSPAHCNRRLSIPKGARCCRSIKLGDVGYWRMSRRGFPFFKVLCNVKGAFTVKIDQMGSDFESITSTLSAHVYVYVMRFGRGDAVSVTHALTPLRSRFLRKDIDCSRGSRQYRKMKGRCV